ncbi:MAG: ABC transporter ATP-binding protein [Urechidicola sp.]|nr:ABC transporter ATP-binding protein [Urechidicola sp.]
MSNQTNKIIEVDSASKSVNGLTILSDVTFTSYNSEVLTIIGENGSGKTTLLGILLDDFKLSNGSVSYFPNKKKFFNNLGVVYDNQVIYPFLKVKELIKYFCAIRKVDYTLIEPKIELFSLSSIEDRMIKNLSAGEKQKLSILLSKIHNPQFLIYDEPFSSIDPLIRAEIWNAVNTENTSVILTTHNWEFAEEISDRIILLHKGKMLCPASSPENIYNKLPSKQKVVISKNVFSNHNFNVLKKLRFYTHKDTVHIFNVDDSFLQELSKITYNFSVLDVQLKDVYYYLLPCGNTQNSVE